LKNIQTKKHPLGKGEERERGEKIQKPPFINKNPSLPPKQRKCDFESITIVKVLGFCSKPKKKKEYH
jgi:hypothetical protein